MGYDRIYSLAGQTQPVKRKTLSRRTPNKNIHSLKHCHTIMQKQIYHITAELLLLLQLLLCMEKVQGLIFSWLIFSKKKKWCFSFCGSSNILVSSHQTAWGALVWTFGLLPPGTCAQGQGSSKQQKQPKPWTGGKSIAVMVGWVNYLLIRVGMFSDDIITTGTSFKMDDCCLEGEGKKV